MRVVRVLSADAGEPTVRPLHDATLMHAEAASATTPIHPGTLEIDATVTLTVEISEAARTGRLVR